MTPKGTQKVAILRCKFSDISDEPHDDQFYKNLFFSRGTRALNDYYITASNGTVNLDDGKLFPWKSVGKTRADYFASYPSRLDRINGAIQAHGVKPAEYNLIFAVFNADTGNAGTWGYTLVGPGELETTWLAHEAGHQFGLNDSYDESDRLVEGSTTPGWYWFEHDIMSARNVHSIFDPDYVARGPLLCAASLDMLGWIPAERMFTPRPNKPDVQDIDLVALGHGDKGPGYLCVQSGSFFLEFRIKEDWDDGIPKHCILVAYLFSEGNNAKVKWNGVQKWDPEWLPGMSFGPSDDEMMLSGGVRVNILSFDVPSKKARLRVTTRPAVHVPVPISQPGQIFGGVAVDGGGWILINGKLIRIPPRSPVMGILNHAAIVSQVEETLTGSVKRSMGSQMYKEIASLADRAARKIADE
ncbi:hypothetical protein DL95DRAFT_491164, partial [Leptodontidium sp. 2 PMI_412]